MVTQLERQITEKEFRQTVIEAAAVLGYKVYFTWNSLHSPSGFPDVVLVNPEKGRVIFAELKSETGKTTEAQEDWLLALGQCPGVETCLWRPSDLDRILEILDGE